MINHNLVTESDLKRVTGCKQRAALERVLRDEQIKFYRGVGGVIWTTVGNLEKAKNNESAEVDF